MRENQKEGVTEMEKEGSVKDTEALGRKETEEGKMERGDVLKEQKTGKEERKKGKPEEERRE